MAEPANWKIWVKRIVKLVIAALVLWAVAWQILQCAEKLKAREQSISARWEWVTVSGLLYLLGLACFGTFTWRIAAKSPTPIAWLPCWRAYIIGHLGKYVPGKALVVVLRAGLAAPFGASPAAMAAGAFYETLVMMAVGGWLSGFLFLAYGLWAGWLGLAMGLGFTILTHPRIFPKIANRVAKKWPDWVAAFPRFDRALLAEGFGWATVGWVLMGLSHVAMIQAFDPSALTLKVWPITIAAVALATVLGFVAAVTPGGLGVREWILMIALEPALGQELAVLSTLALRLVWILAEAIASGVFYVAIRPPGSPTTPASISPRKETP